MQISVARHQANQANARLSTGPATEAGKAASSQNALKHGLTSARIVLPGEDADAYDTIRTNLFAEFAPATETERTLVDEIAATSWRLARARAVETAVVRRLRADAGLDDEQPSEALARLMFDKPKELEKLQRYIASFERAYYRALNKLLKLQAERLAREEEERDEYGQSYRGAMQAFNDTMAQFTGQLAATGEDDDDTDDEDEGDDESDQDEDAEDESSDGNRPAYSHATAERHTNPVVPSGFVSQNSESAESRIA